MCEFIGINVLTVTTFDLIALPVSDLRTFGGSGWINNVTWKDHSTTFSNHMHGEQLTPVLHKIRRVWPHHSPLQWDYYKFRILVK